eukprot:TRINITY_DN9528_c0_g1_i9.p3 TRINITY_DN9528_c0_g1~~TRINITY_DN9528_c0_g1_i9.p3  ORF type:complete len:117 (+),score=26.44 TRINITY_DN9528_c0_g1_i9:1435-1785(+)
MPPNKLPTPNPRMEFTVMLRLECIGLEECRITLKGNARQAVPVAPARKQVAVSSTKAVEMKEDFLDSKRSRKLSSIYSIEEAEMANPKTSKEMKKQKTKTMHSPEMQRKEIPSTLS